MSKDLHSGQPRSPLFGEEDLSQRTHLSCARNCCESPSETSRATAAPPTPAATLGDSLVACGWPQGVLREPWLDRCKDPGDTRQPLVSPPRPRASLAEQALFSQPFPAGAPPTAVHPTPLDRAFTAEAPHGEDRPPSGIPADSHRSRTRAWLWWRGAGWQGQARPCPQCHGQFQPVMALREFAPNLPVPKTSRK